MESKIPNGNLLIVEDEDTFLKILEKLFLKRYNIKSASSGEEALDILKGGFQAEVILSDQKMSGMTGAEFLEKSMEFVPNATRIIISAFTNPRDIIPCINQGHAYSFLTKPADELEILQAVKVGFDYYNSAKKNKMLITELNSKIKTLNEKNLKLKTVTEDNQLLFSQVVQAITGIINPSEKYYFTHHSKTVAVIARALAKEMNMDSPTISLIVLASLLHNITMIGMPVKFMLFDPHELTQEDKTLYFDNFSSAITNLSKIKQLQKHTQLIAQIWAHNDGSGYPEELTGQDISKEAQILALSNLFHNLVYRVKPELLSNLSSQGFLSQDKMETRKRLDEAMKFLYRKASWFDYDVFHNFIDLIKSRKCPALVTEEKTLYVYDIDTNPYKIIPEETIQRSDNSDDSTDNSNNDNEAAAPAAKAEKKITIVEKEIPVEDLKAGMKVSNNVVTKNGFLLVRQESTIDASLLKKIKQLESTGMLPPSIVILIEKED